MILDSSSLALSDASYLGMTGGGGHEREWRI